MAYVFFNTGSPTGSGSWATAANWYDCPGGIRTTGTGLLPSVTDCVILESNICTLGANRAVASICNDNATGSSFCGGKHIKVVGGTLTLCGALAPSKMVNGSVINVFSCCVIMTASTPLTIQSSAVVGTRKIDNRGGTIDVCNSSIGNGVCLTNCNAGTIQFFNSTIEGGTIVCNAASSLSKIFFSDSMNCGTVTSGSGNTGDNILFSNSLNYGNINLGGVSTSVVFGCTVDDCSVNFGNGCANCFIFCGCSINCGGGSNMCYRFHDTTVNYGCAGGLLAVCFYNYATNIGGLSAACTWVVDDAINCGDIYSSCSSIICGGAINEGKIRSVLRNCFFDTSVNTGSACASCTFLRNNAINCGVICSNTSNCLFDTTDNQGIICGTTVMNTANDNTGTICGNATFLQASNIGCVVGNSNFCTNTANTENCGLVTGTACFGTSTGSYNSYNSGMVCGDATFTGNGVNEVVNYGCVAGNTSFSCGAGNQGSVGSTSINTATFTCAAYNSCTICGNGAFSRTGLFCEGLITGNGCFSSSSTPGSLTSGMPQENSEWGQYGGCICGDMRYLSDTAVNASPLCISKCTPLYFVNVGGRFCGPGCGIGPSAYNTICFFGDRSNDLNTTLCGNYRGKFQNYYFCSGDINCATLQGSDSVPLINVEFNSNNPSIYETANYGTIISDGNVETGYTTNILFTGTLPSSNNYGTIVGNADFTCDTINSGTICGNAGFYATPVVCLVPAVCWFGNINTANFSSVVGGNSRFYAYDLNTSVLSGSLGTVNFSNTKGAVLGTCGLFACVILACNDIYCGHNTSIPAVIFNDNSINAATISDSNTCVIFKQNSLNCGTIYCGDTVGINTDARILEQGCVLCDLTIDNNNVTDCCNGGVWSYLGCAQYSGTSVYGAKINGRLIDKASGCIVPIFNFSDCSQNCGKVPPNALAIFNQSALNSGTVTCACTNNICNNDGIRFLNQGCYLCDLSISENCVTDCFNGSWAYRGCAQFSGTDMFGARIDGKLIDKVGNTCVQVFALSGCSFNCGRVPSNVFTVFNQCALNCGTVNCACTNSICNNNGFNFLRQGCYLCDLSLSENCVTDCFNGSWSYKGCAQYTGSNIFGARVDGCIIDKVGSSAIQNFNFCDTSYNTGKIPAKACFNNASHNDGTITRSAMFKNTSYNTGTIALTGLLCDCTYNTGCICCVSFNGYAYNGCGGTFTNLIAYNSLQKGISGAPILGGSPPKTTCI